MKKLLALIVLILTFSQLGINAHATNNVQEYNIYSTGLFQTLNTSIEVDEEGISYILEEDGEEVSGTFNVDGNYFTGELFHENTKYNLNGSIVGEELYYEGEVEGQESMIFQALLTKVEENSNNYKATISFLEYENLEELEDREEPIAVQTYIFDGSTKKVKKVYPEPVKGEGGFSIMNSGSQVLASASTSFLSTRVIGINAIRQGSNEYHSVRSVTKTEAVDQHWRNQGYSVFRSPAATKVTEHTISASLSTSTCTGCRIYSKDPATSSTSSFNLPAYIPSLGFTTIPVRLSTVKINGSGSGAFSYVFTWGSWSSARDGDDSSLDTKSAATFGATYEVKTAHNTQKVNHRIDGRSRITYVTRGLTASGYVYLSRQENNSFFYTFKVN
ncbi:hypothetical protein M3936_23330 [Sutcliffiella horikoshii]|uniref:hypothetical protein n=1 Tax=Sutcliffiella horikoshii TaxID=79883 RepID=UPI00203D2A7D|nr:hypothetical protein [Sutcliffiella horikoshii]MCM3620491.1 hypothetical protein [Sutcliffiella horikoshii]